MNIVNFTQIQRRPIFVVGAPRTGTSWIAKTISMAPCIRYVREPILQGKPEGFNEKMNFIYLKAYDDYQEYEKVWRTALSLKYWFSQPWLLSESYWLFRRLPFLPVRLLVKEVNCILALELIAKLFNPYVVITMRHPCGYVASGIRLLKKGHPVVELKQLISQKSVFQEYSYLDREWLLSLNDPISQMAAAYGMVYKVIANQIMKYPEWIVLNHDCFCRNPKAEFTKLFCLLGVNYNKRVDKFVDKVSSVSDEELYSVQRKSANEHIKWKFELTKIQIETVRTIWLRFEVPFYQDLMCWQNE
jgi:hypothetical protein